ncbi:uncharacterized protein LOC118735163 [Rhagoletis pomonella]|uniref:uncharacterized protein LOC118735163 n=1 Tax=Rhagoletis pomonella TaxID=28610 RepID=UPI0017820A33|nr:uncharacterized protein LOC118735163 [Rhagoletis pomonella]XP_036320693.1 uncharacterized protein LOC118735163 [Rhagoletis pomonella]
MTYKLAKVFQKFNIRTSFRTRNNVGRMLNNSTNEEDTLDKQGVYKLTRECKCSYIRQTGRKIKTRFREHIRDYHKRIQKPSVTPESNFANHKFENKYTPMKINKAAKLLHVQHKGRRLNILENIEIYKQKAFQGSIINEQTNTVSDVIFEPLKMLYEKYEKTPGKKRQREDT